MKTYFRVSAAWMIASGNGDAARVYEVLSCEHNDSTIAVDHDGATWFVLTTRGHYVMPYTLLLCDGLFSVAAADVIEPGNCVRSAAEFDTFDAAQAAALRMNDHIRAVRAASIPKIEISRASIGQFVHRLRNDGLPMAKTWRVGCTDTDMCKIALHDPFDSSIVFWMKAGTLVALDIE